MSVAEFTALPGLKGAVDLHRMLHRGVRLPRVAVDAIVRGVKFGRCPGQASLRRRHASEIQQRFDSTQEIPEDLGYQRYDPGHFPGADDALAYADRLFAEIERSGGIEQTASSAKKNFLLSVVRGRGFLDHPEMLSFMISRPIVDIASRYFGSVPVLSSVSLWWTPPNDTVEKSQLFHRDSEDARQLKFFFNIRDVTEDSGPFTFLSADKSEPVKRALGYNSGRVDDARVIEAAGGEGAQIRMTGPAGSGAAVDTSRCLHYGSRGNTVGRLVLMFQFTSFFAPKAEAPAWAEGIGATGLELDEVQKLVLGIA